MITVRISFEKKNEASYISLLDLQRVMQRVLKRSGLPVWHTLGFNPHIYMTFACPLSLGQESECECVDVKTEAEAPDFAQWRTALNAIMPAGIHVTRVAPVEMKADSIAFECGWSDHGTGCNGYYQRGELHCSSQLPVSGRAYPDCAGFRYRHRHQCAGGRQREQGRYHPDPQR